MRHVLMIMPIRPHIRSRPRLTALSLLRDRPSPVSRSASRLRRIALMGPGYVRP